MFFSKLLVVVSLTISAFSLPFEKRTVSALLADLADGENQLISINNYIKAFSPTSGTDDQASVIQIAAVALTKTFTQATKDVPSGTASESDAKLIISLIEGATPQITTALSNLVLRKTRLDTLGDTEIVSDTIADLGDTVEVLENRLIDYAPTDLKARATSAANIINAAFAAAKEAFA